jgi:hypothetical protein
MIIISHIIAQTKEQQELGADFLALSLRQGQEKRLMRQRATLGFDVALPPLASQPSTISVTLSSFGQTLPSQCHF